MGAIVYQMEFKMEIFLRLHKRLLVSGELE